MKLCLLFFLLFVLYAQAYEYSQIISRMKTIFARHNSTEINSEMKKHWQQSGLFNNGSFTLVELEQYESKIFAPVDIEGFLTRAEGCWKANSYMNALMATSTPLDPFNGTMSQLDEIIFSATCYAVVLDRFTEIVRADYRVLVGSLRELPKIQKLPEYRQKVSLFGRAKYATVKYCLDNIADSFKEGHIVPINGKLTIPANIHEAVLTDLAAGYWRNAGAGKMLALFYNLASNSSTTLVKDPTNPYNVSFLYKYPAPQEWDDLYSVWNMAFVVRYPDAWPFFFAKLLTPAVACYQDSPNEYLYMRGTALWMHLNWYERKNIIKDLITPMDWPVPKMRSAMGSINLASANKYQYDARHSK